MREFGITSTTGYSDSVTKRVGTENDFNRQNDDTKTACIKEETGKEKPITTVSEVSEWSVGWSVSMSSTGVAVFPSG